MAKKWITAEELMAELQADPDWVRGMAEADARHAASVAKLRAELEPEEAALRRDLRRVGMHTHSVSDLVNMDAPYPPEAVPILVHHLQAARHPVMRSSLARALTVEQAEGVAGGPLLRELRRETDPNARWVMANALTIVATPDDADEIAALVRDPEYKDVRSRLRQALKNVRPNANAQLAAKAQSAAKAETTNWLTKLGLR